MDPLAHFQLKISSNKAVICESSMCQQQTDPVGSDQCLRQERWREEGIGQLVDLPVGEGLRSRVYPKAEKPVKGSMRQKSLGISVLSHFFVTKILWGRFLFAIRRGLFTLRSLSSMSVNITRNGLRLSGLVDLTRANSPQPDHSSVF
ncbi:hypothetical protein TNCV_3634261 [Trichonephila clavipes]|nr:hypothetical protein TNCV_3634261 [Trichonephila clavipes]